MYPVALLSSFRLTSSSTVSMAFSDPTDEEDEEPLPRRLVFGDRKPWKYVLVRPNSSR
jgi:hypothetical protein